jgi:hypothetical protein
MNINDWIGFAMAMLGQIVGMVLWVLNRDAQRRRDKLAEMAMLDAKIEVIRREITAMQILQASAVGRTQVEEWFNRFEAKFDKRLDSFSNQLTQAFKLSASRRNSVQDSQA